MFRFCNSYQIQERPIRVRRKVLFLVFLHVNDLFMHRIVAGVIGRWLQGTDASIFIDSNYPKTVLKENIWKIDSQTCVKTTTVGASKLWPLLAGGRCSEVTLCSKHGKRDPGRYRQVVGLRIEFLRHLSWESFYECERLPISNDRRHVSVSTQWGWAR